MLTGSGVCGAVATDGVPSLPLPGLNRSGSLLNLPVPLVQKPGMAGVLSVAKSKEKQLPEQPSKQVSKG